jgi:NADH:ubiquinone oxidoreductase subunit D
MYESISIIFQILSNLTNLSSNPLAADTNVKNNSDFFSFFSFVFEQQQNKLNKNTKYTSMETLINHFKHYSEGLKINRGFVYKAVEAPKGEFGVSLIADNTANPYRCKIRTPAYHHIQVMPRLVQGHFFADLVTVLGSQDIVFGDVDR